ncbi:hypothetical protein [Ligilactobacillus ruminis]|uniref:Phage protein n=1 Tax=Ligilactobacillus ruminis (strain ATCC 27782 / RF3) TaxID=1069534 RepID=G2SN46_LIGR2|nr:hypothetical protein [Ligilactobacillus ruminis]AEN78020.1 Phage protein [Ligilactobacillus ruminis ATCC 27782]
MSKNRFVLKRSGVAQLLKSNEMQSALKAKATIIRERCGDGYEQDIYVGKNRANTMVYADSIKAKRSNAKHNVLLKAVNAARD